MFRKTILLPLLAGLILTAATACASGDTTPAPTSTSAPQDPQNIQVAFSDKPRSDYENVPLTNVSELVDGNTRFAFNLYQTLSEEDGNLFFSPHSISLALAMTYAGSAGETEIEMQQALHFTLSQVRLHEAINALDQQLAARGEDAPEDERFTLEIANSIWGQQSFNFNEDYLDTLAENYGAGIRLVDFVPDETREAARQAINQWVEENTNDRIRDLIPQGILNDMTRLVLANAIYFKASWARTFNAEYTQDGEFTLLNGSNVTVPMMDTQRNLSFNYGQGDGYQAVELPYVGNSASMVILLPEEGAFEQFQSGLDAERLDEILGGMSSEKVRVSMPKFEFESEFSLSDALKALGMEQAFSPGGADFSGISETPLFIREVLHKSYVSVDEEGTEAAAATAVIGEATSAPLDTYEFVAETPFIFLIRDIETGAVLFLGRVLNPES